MICAMAEQTEASDQEAQGGSDGAQAMQAQRRTHSTSIESIVRPSLRRRQSTILRDARDKVTYPSIALKGVRAELLHIRQHSWTQVQIKTLVILPV